VGRLLCLFHVGTPFRCNENFHRRLSEGLLGLPATKWKLGEHVVGTKKTEMKFVVNRANQRKPGFGENDANHQVC